MVCGSAMRFWASKMREGVADLTTACDHIWVMLLDFSLVRAPLICWSSLCMRNPGESSAKTRLDLLRIRSSSSLFAGNVFGGFAMYIRVNKKQKEAADLTIAHDHI